MRDVQVRLAPGRRARIAEFEPGAAGCRRVRRSLTARTSSPSNSLAASITRSSVTIVAARSRGGQRRSRLLRPLQRRRRQVGDVGAGQVVGDTGGHLPGRTRPAGSRAAGRRGCSPGCAPCRAGADERRSCSSAASRPGDGLGGRPDRTTGRAPRNCSRCRQLCEAGDSCSAVGRSCCAAGTRTSGPDRSPPTTAAARPTSAAPAAAVSHGPEYLVIAVFSVPGRNGGKCVGPDPVAEQQQPGTPTAASTAATAVQRLDLTSRTAPRPASADRPTGAGRRCSPRAPGLQPREVDAALPDVAEHHGDDHEQRARPA